MAASIDEALDIVMPERSLQNESAYDGWLGPDGR